MSTPGQLLSAVFPSRATSPSLPYNGDSQRSYSYSALSLVGPPESSKSSCQQKSQELESETRKRPAKKIVIIAVTLSLFAIILSTLLIALLRRHHNRASPIGPIVHLDYGTYLGSHSNPEVNSFLGMRFAAPPIGDRRWRGPAPPEVFKGTQSANQTSPDCTTDEDCLKLNVFAPANATSASKLPVWFYIEGGGYGGLCCNNNNTQVVATGNVVVVSISYRPGAFGFLASETIRQEGDLNIGLLDQRAALEWTRTHIDKFGGDPDHIVIHGASAGAGSVAHHLVAYGGRNDNLFIGAIAQSPYVIPEMAVKDLEWQFDRFVEDARCNHTQDVMACLRSRDFDVLKEANVNHPFPGRQNKSQRSWGPTIDGSFLQAGILDLFEQGKFLNVPMMVGNEPNEAIMLSPNAESTGEVEEFFNENDPTLSRTQLEAITEWYPEKILTPEHSDYFGVINQAYSQATFICPGIEITGAMANYSASTVWNYSYNVSTNESWTHGLGAWHTIDTGAIFGPYLYGEPLSEVSLAYQTYNSRFVDYMMNYYLSFIKTLSPNTLKHVDAPEFGQFESQGAQQRLNLHSDNTGMMKVPDSLIDNCRFWRELRHNASL